MRSVCGMTLRRDLLRSKQYQISNVVIPDKDEVVSPDEKVQIAHTEKSSLLTS